MAEHQDGSINILTSAAVTAASGNRTDGDERSDDTADNASTFHPLVPHADEEMWGHAYSSRALNTKQSETRSLFAVVNRPEVVSLAGGMPNIAGLPLDFLADMTARLVRQRGTELLQYGGGQGERELREQIVHLLGQEGVHASPDQITVTTGSQAALDIVTQVLVNPGDTIVAEAPSYVGALGVFAAHEANVVHVPMDDNGLIPEELERTLTQLESEGTQAKFIYTVPNFHNPGGVCLSIERRPQIVNIARRHRVVILEDNPYGMLGFDDQTNRALYNWNPDGIIYLGSFSKIFAPGYRVGWALASDELTARLVLANENAVLSPTKVGQLSIAEYLRTYDWLGQIKEYRVMYCERRNAMNVALSKYLPQCEWTVPGGGFYFWVKLPEGINARHMLPRAVDNGVAYVSGTAFYADGTGADHIRLSFCYPTPEQITEGIRRLSKTIEAEMFRLND
ncbi:aminotransferase-like domain-containing protein [Arcanobacterium haemolyticum]|uniref:Transcriptional regulator, GntR family n=1 Tax=Arcanobacterium haemolyticum (strain ATCC 9345 / DSM 20595 / CCM 5947 / CCUG 17215 / LMG 16163 / NBRC 15585 / NCTC 8452 / 11018) TaxID=644284 RepID=D7BLG0_ARCHD|nr:PLP-dependent aminotransferase family protein [Arcanobacterium haemolyticum]ADH93490.1 putative transcriptional regulator, GntR family [Arcanobacterium haemolyticum DSM 20595]SQH27470.1 2-aminoadipate transaminase [Arcanobacterium haemolyticum]